MNLLTLDALEIGRPPEEHLDAGAGVKERQPARLVLGDLARLRFQLGEDEARRVHQSQVRPPSLDHFESAGW
jgi:hypothetical protein